MQFDGDKLIGGDDIVNGFKSTHADAFKADEKLPKFLDSTLRAVMGLE